MALLVAEKSQEGKAQKRELGLSEADVVRLLDSLGGATFTLEADGGTWCNMSATEADPDVLLRIVSSQDGAYQLVRDERVTVAVGSGHAYAFVDGEAYQVLQRVHACGHVPSRRVLVGRRKSWWLPPTTSPSSARSVLPRAREEPERRRTRRA